MGSLARSAVAVVAVVVSTTLAPGALAADPSMDAVAAALRRFDEGRVAFDAHRYDEARAAFEASYRLQASPNSLLYIGRCYRETGKLGSAYVTLRRSAREAEDRRAATLEQRYAATRDAAAGEATALETRVPHLVIAVPAGLPRDFTVKLGDEAVPNASWGLAVETDPGPVVVTATGRRMKPYRVAFTLKEGEHHRVDVTIARVPTATVTVAMRSRPAGMQIELDDQPIDPREASEPHELDVGAHRIVVRAPGYVPFRWERSLADGERANVDVALATARSASGTPPALFYGVAAGAVVLAAVGAALALSANASNSREEAKSPLVRDSATRDSIRTRSSIADGLFVSSAVLGAGATVLIFTTAWPTKNHGLAVGVSGTF